MLKEILQDEEFNASDGTGEAIARAWYDLFLVTSRASSTTG
jgi:hypothetical protein